MPSWAERRAARHIAAAILAREDVDWPRVEPPGSAGSLLSSLALIARVSGRVRPAVGERAGLTAGEERVPAWQQAVIAFATAQVLLGVVGFLAGTRDAVPIAPGFPAATALTFGACAAWLLVGGRGSRRNAALAGLLLAIASGTSLRFVRWVQPSLPDVLLPRLWTALLPECFFAAFAWLFVRDFPRVSPWSRPLRGFDLGVAVSIALGWALLLANAAAAWRSPARPAADPVFGVLTRSHPLGLHWTLLFACAGVAFAALVLRIRSASPEERSRAALFIAGLVGGFAPVLVDVLLDYVIPAYARFKERADPRHWTSNVIYAALLTIPLTTTYAVLARGALPMSRVLHRAAQRLLARSLLLALAAASLAGLAVHVYVHRQQSAAEIFGSPRGLLLAGTGLLAVVGTAWRERLLALVDQVFGRHSSNWRAVLAEASAALGIARTPVELESELGRQLGRALGVPRCALLVRAPRDDGFAAVSGVPAALTDASALTALASASPEPILTDADDPRSLYRLLPSADREWLAEHGVAMMARLDGDPRPRAILAVGPRRDRFFFSPEDMVLVRAIAATSTLALENQELRHPAADEVSAEECPACGVVAARGASRCDCGSVRQPSLLPLSVNGKFEVRRRIGAGAMGVVYEARDAVLDRTVALKALPGVSVEAARRMRQEARAMAAVVHPHLALILGAETCLGMPVLVLEYLAGGTLDRRLQPRWPPGRVVELGRALAGALQELHRHGLVHRDVKPSNIGFTGDGSPKLLDFGLARLREEAVSDAPGAPAFRGEGSTSWGTDGLAGTPLYLPPEILGGSHPAQASTQDLWALSMVLFELVAGAHPLADEEIRRRYLGEREPLPDVRRFTPECPAELAALLARALHPEPARRPASAAEILAGLADPVIPSR